MTVQCKKLPEQIPKLQSQIIINAVRESVCGGLYLALASAAPGGTAEVEGSERSGGVHEAREGGTWERVADRNAGSSIQVGGAVGVVSQELSPEEPLQ